MSKPVPAKIGGEFGDIRANIDVPKLNEYLLKQVSGLAGPIDVKQFKVGALLVVGALGRIAFGAEIDSSLDSGKRLVLRKKPAGKLISKTAHQIEREFTILNALHKHNVNPSTTADQRVPVPEPILLCEDDSIIGTPFYVMEFLDGRIFTDPKMLEVPPRTRRECWLSAVRVLATLSSLSPSALGLSNFGPSTDYFARQIRSISRVSKAQAEAVDVDTNKKTGDIPFFEDLIDWYQKHLPDEKRLGLRIVHGDYKLDNLVFHPTENRVIGILDWELCTLGNPLADLGNMTMQWSIDLKDVPPIPGNETNTLMNGFKGNSRDAPIALEDLEREYCRLTHQPYPIKEMVFVRSWMLFRLAVISQGIAARYARRQASSASAHIQVHNFPIIGKLAKIVLEEAGYSIGPSPKL